MANGQDKFRDVVRGVVLPSLAIGESILTRGASPGTASLQVAGAIDKREAERLKREAEEKAIQRQRERDAFQRQVQGFQFETLKEKRSEKAKIAASRAILKKKLELAGEDQGKIEEALLQHQLRTDPDQAFKFLQSQRAFEQKRKLEKQKATRAEDLLRQREKIRLGKEAKDVERFQKKEKREFLKDQRDFKKSFIADNRVRSFNEVDSSFERINSVWSKRPDKGDVLGSKKRAAIDQSLITLFNKMLDPGSVVRESEYARTPQNVPVINRIQGRLQQVTEGGAGLTDTDRNEIFEVAKRLFESSLDRYRGILKTYDRDAVQSGFEKENIFTPRDLSLLGERAPDDRLKKIEASLQSTTDINQPNTGVQGFSNTEMTDMMTFIRNNPTDERAQRMKERLQSLGIEVP